MAAGAGVDGLPTGLALATWVVFVGEEGDVAVGCTDPEAGAVGALPATLNTFPQGHLTDRPAWAASIPILFPHLSHTARILEPAFGASTARFLYLPLSELVASK